jgi:hypothetical protein
MPQRLAALGGILLLAGCSDAAAPGPGSFHARLSGVRMTTLSGESGASPFFGVEYPDARFAIRMFDQGGGEVRALVLHCPGETPPPAGAYAVSTAVADCAGSYSRVRTTVEGEISVLETMQASSGQLTVNAVDGGEVTGSFNFQGTLVVGSDSGGRLLATGAFSSTTFP